MFNDDAEAVRLYRKAAELNQPTAIYKVGWMYANGRGVAGDFAQAVTLYRKAAELGSVDALYSLGQAYQDGLGVEKDPIAAADWISKANNAFAVKEMTTNAEAWSKAFRRELQRRMREAGVYDGKFGEGTKTAIEALAKQSPAAPAAGQ